MASKEVTRLRAMLDREALEDVERTKHLPAFIPDPVKDRYATTWRRLSQNFNDPSGKLQRFTDAQIRVFIERRRWDCFSYRNGKLIARRKNSLIVPGFVVDGGLFLTDVDFLAFVDCCADQEPEEALEALAGRFAVMGYKSKIGGKKGGERKALPITFTAPCKSYARKLWDDDPSLSSRACARKIAKRYGGNVDTIRRKIADLKPQ